MFTTPNLAMTEQSMRVHVRSANDEHTHVIDAAFSLPLTYDLAYELGPSVARDLFILAKRNGENDWIPKPEITNVRLLLETSAYIVEMKPHPDAPIRVRLDRIPGVRIKGIGATKGDTPNGALWTLHFVMAFELADFSHLQRIAQGLKLTQYLTFLEEQPAMKEPRSDNPSTGPEPPKPSQPGFDTIMKSDQPSGEQGLMRQGQQGLAPTGGADVVDGEIVDANAPPANEAPAITHDAPPDDAPPATDVENGPTF